MDLMASIVVNGVEMIAGRCTNPFVPKMVHKPSSRGTELSLEFHPGVSWQEFSFIPVRTKSIEPYPLFVT